MVRAVVIAIVLSLGGVARAGDDPAIAKQAFVDGTRLYDLRKFREALASFELAYMHFESPALLYNIAQCRRELGEFGEAKRFYATYLRLSPEAKDRVEVEKIIADLDVRIARAHPPSIAESPPVLAPALAPAVAARASLIEPPAQTSAKARPIARRPLFWGILAGAAIVVGGGLALGLAFGLPPASPMPTQAVLTIPGM